MRLIVEELKNRSFSLFIMGLLFFLCSFFCGSFIFLETNKISDSIPFRVSLTTMYTAIMLWSLGWMNEYLYQKKIRQLFNRVYPIVFLIMLILSVTTVLRGVEPHPHADLPFDRLSYAIYLTVYAIFILCFFLNTCLLFFQHKMPISQQYTWGVRLGYLIFLLPLFMEFLSLLSIYFIDNKIGSRTGSLLTQWINPVGGLRIAHFMGIFSLQFLPLVSNYVFKKKKEVQIFAVCYFLCIVLMIIMTLLRQPLLPA